MTVRDVTMAIWLGCRSIRLPVEIGQAGAAWGIGCPSAPCGDPESSLWFRFYRAPKFWPVWS